MIFRRDADLKLQWPQLTMRVEGDTKKKTGRNLNFNGKETWQLRKQGIAKEDAPRGLYQWILYNVIEKFEESSKNLTKLINSQISAKDKVGLGYDSQMNESEVVYGVFNSKESDVDDSLVNDRFKTGEGFHAVPPPYTRNYMPSRLDLSFTRLDDSVYKTKVSETITTASKTNKDSLEGPKTVRPSAPIIKEWDTDSDNDSVFRPKTDQTKPRFTKINFVKSDENVKSVNKENTHKNFVPIAIATKSGQVPVNAAKQNSPRAAASISTDRPVNIASLKSKVNDALPKTYSYFKAHSPVRRVFNQKSTAKTNNLNEKVKTARVNNVTTARPKAVVSAAVEMGKMLLSPQHAEFGDQQEMLLTIPLKTVDYTCLKDLTMLIYKADSSQKWLGSPRETNSLILSAGNKSFLTYYQEIDGGFVAFVGSPKGGKITEKGKIRTKKLDFKDVYFVKELKFNLFSVLQICDKKNSVLFTETGCLVLSPDFKLLDESQVLLKVPRQNNMYSFDLKNAVPLGGLTCLYAKATIDESNLWYRRLGHINFKTMNKLMRGNLVRGLPLKLFKNDHSCVACQKGEKHKASYKTKLVSSISYPLQMLHMDLFGPTFVRSINHKIYCLVVTDDYSRKADEGFLVGYSINSKAFRVFNTRTRKVEENLHINFLENKPNVTGSGPEWLFDIDSLTKSMNYEPEKASDHEYILLPLMVSNSPLSLSSQSTYNKDADEVPGKGDDDLSERNGQEKEKGATNKEDDQHSFAVNPSVSAVGQGFDNADDQERINSSTQDINTAGPSINTANENINIGSSNINTAIPIPNDPSMQSLEATGIFSGAYDDEDVGAKANLNNLEITMNVSSIPITRIHKDHPKDQIIRDINSATQTKRMTKITKGHAMASYIKRQRRTNHKDY
ncbi:putative ribonuclease H-like domain-containing protein [Tanacetum coccineum]|uniref:Ribonuclease H-like domain-containing protein n=1 Tax=Tanacetum coccineum TaxID=301880 RepID=A0ABQ5EQX9_9ASTR